MKLTLIQFSALFLMLIMLCTGAVIQYKTDHQNKRANAVLAMAYQLYK